MSTAAIPPDCIPLGEAVIFDSHQEWSSEGDLIRDFSEDRLHEICDFNNNLINTRGHFSPLGPGHNIIPRDGERVPESMMPPIWGWAGNFRVAPHPKDPEKPCIVVDTYAKTTKEPDGSGKMIDPATELKRYPFPSVELHQTDGDGRRIAGMIDRIACLRQAPRRALGPMFYSKASGVHQGTKTRAIYADPSKINRLAAAERGSVLFYAMESAMPFNDPTSDASATEPGMGEIDTLIEALKTRFPKLAALMIEEPPAPALDAGGPPLGDAPGGDLPLPGGGDAPGGDLPMPDKDPMMFSRTDARSQANQIAWLKKELDRVEKERLAEKKAKEDEALQYSKADAERICDVLEVQFGVDMDRQEEILHFQRLPIGEARQKRADYIRSKYKTLNQGRSAPRGPVFPSAPNGTATGPVTHYSRAACEAASAECAEKGDMSDASYKAALEKHKDKR